MDVGAYAQEISRLRSDHVRPADVGVDAPVQSFADRERDRDGYCVRSGDRYDGMSDDRALKPFFPFAYGKPFGVTTQFSFSQEQYLRRAVIEVMKRLGRNGEY
jgi:hypothetical protein